MVPACVYRLGHVGPDKDNVRQEKLLVEENNWVLENTYSETIMTEGRRWSEEKRMKKHLSQWMKVLRSIPGWASLK